MTELPLAQAGPSCSVCETCGRWAENGGAYPYVPTAWSKEYVVVLPSVPGRSAEAWRQMLAPWWALCRKVGIAPQAVAFVPAIRCGEEDVTTAQGKSCRPFFLRAMRQLSPKYVLLVGSTAIHMWTGNWRPVRPSLLCGVSFQQDGGPAVYACEDPQSPEGSWEAVARELRRLTEPILSFPPVVDHPIVSECVAVDTEFEDRKLLTVACATPVHAVVRDVDQPDFDHVIRASVSSAVKLVGHHVWVDVDWLVELGLCRETWVNGVDVVDTNLLARMADETLGTGAYGVEALLRRYYRVEGWKTETDEIDPIHPSRWPAELRRRRCAVDAWASWNVKDAVRAKGPVEFTHRIAATLHRVHHAGMAMDTSALAEYVEFLRMSRDAAKQRFLQCTAQYGMPDVSPTNDAQLRELIYGKLGLQVTTKTPKGLPSVAKDVLLPYRDHPVIDELLTYNELDRTLAAIEGEKGVLANLQPLRDGVSLLPVNIWPLRAKTARRSSTSPNVQNWTVQMRKMVRSRWDGGAILDVDYRSLEPRVLGAVAPDHRYLSYFVDGRGYVGIAADVLRKDVEKGTPEYRTVKEIVLGTNYGAGPTTIGKKLWMELGVKLARTIDAHLTMVRKLQDRYLHVFSGIQSYMARQERELLRSGRVVTATGRVRHLPCPDGEETPGFAHMRNQAYNYPIQSLASDITGSALVDVEDAICQWYGISKVEYHAMLFSRLTLREIPCIINEIHDEVVFDLPPPGKKHEELMELITDVMRRVLSFRKVSSVDVPLDVEAIIAPTWGAKK